MGARKSYPKGNFEFCIMNDASHGKGNGGRQIERFGVTGGASNGN
jgi:hypothetical protein